MKTEKRDIGFIESSARELQKLLCDETKHYIFGCGWMGTKFMDAVTALGYTVDGFVVTKKTESCLNGVPVFALTELEKKQAATIFVALRDQDPELKARLETLFDRVCPITYPRDITLIEALFYLEYFRKKGIAYSGSIMELKGFSFINPFLESDDYLLSWVYEAGDLILPVLFDDYSRIDEGPYETEHTVLCEDDVVLDCGANIGLFTNIAIQKKCQVYAFEPMPDAITYLRELQDFHGERLELCPYALSDNCGTAAFHVQNFDLLGASMLENKNSIDKDYEVDVITIDEFVRQNNLKQVDYIKADIEGSERDMLKGAVDTIRRFHPKISICTYHLPDDKEVLEHLLKEIEPSYVIEHKWKKMYAYIPEPEEGDL